MTASVFSSPTSIEIAADGKVERVSVVQSAGDDFDTAAVAAARQFVFEPAEIDGKPGGMCIMIPNLNEAIADLHGVVVVANAVRHVHDHAVGEREQRVILADAHVLARVHAGSALTHENRAGVNLSSVEHLDTEALRV